MNPKAMEIADAIYGGTVPCDLRIEAEMEERRLRLATTIDAALKAERRAALEAACKVIRSRCSMCHSGVCGMDSRGDAIECEYCGRPMMFVRELLAKEGE